MEKNYASGILGGLIGGFLFSIPWILMNVYGQMILSVLAMVIGFGILLGYKLLFGKVDNALPIIIYAIAIFVIAMDTLIIIPALDLILEGYEASIENLRLLYQYSDYLSAILKDLGFGLIFGLLGVSAVASKVKNQLRYGDNYSKDILKDSSIHQEEVIRNFFVENSATSEEMAMTVDYSMGFNQNSFIRLQNEGVIQSVDGKYYYDLDSEEVYLEKLEAENTRNKKKKRLVFIIIGVLSALIAIGVVVSIISKPNYEIYEITSDSQFGYSKNFEIYEDPDNDNSWYLLDKDDPEGDIAYAYFGWYNDQIYEYAADDVEYYKTVFNSYDGDTVTKALSYVTLNSHEVVEVVIDCETYIEIIDIVYEDGNMFFIEIVADTLEQAEQFQTNSHLLDYID